MMYIIGKLERVPFNRVNKMRDIVESGIGQDSDDKGSAMWLINGITSYYQNYANYKSEETKFDNIQSGSVSRRFKGAYDLDY